MSELKFVLKCLLFATGVVLLSQMKMDNKTIESKAQAFLQQSEVARVVVETAEGGVKFINELIMRSQEIVKKKMAQAGGEAEPSSENEEDVF